MTKQRKRYSAEFKAKAALEVVKAQRSLNELASEYEVGYPLSANQLMQWKRQLLESLPLLFADRRSQGEKEQVAKEAELYQQIGQLKVELDCAQWAPEKNLACSVAERRALIELGHTQLSVVRQCELLGITRSGYYYQPIGEQAENQQLMRLIDAEYTRHPFYGYRKITHWLRDTGHLVNKKRVQRLMQTMGLAAIVPKPSLSNPHPAHPVYPYLLRGVKIEQVNQVWSTDITYIPLQQGWMYLVAIIDWFSRYVLAWEISNTLDTDFCLVVLERALKQATPTIFNTDRAPGGTIITVEVILRSLWRGELLGI